MCTKSIDLKIVYEHVQYDMYSMICRMYVRMLIAQPVYAFLQLQYTVLIKYKICSLRGVMNIDNRGGGARAVPSPRKNGEGQKL